MNVSRFLAPAVAACATLALVGCDSGGPTAVPSGTPEATAPAATTGAAPAPAPGVVPGAGKNKAAQGPLPPPGA